MSLYYEAAALLANPDKTGGSLKSRIFKQIDAKSSPGQLFALISEASKWSPVLKHVIEQSGLLAHERKLTPILALLLTHDLILAKGGVAASANHVLKLAISRHKARLNAEFTKARIKAGHPTLEAFRLAVNSGELEPEQDGVPSAIRHPRWVRINTLKTTLAEQLSTTFAGYEKLNTIETILTARGLSKTLYIDEHIPNLIALPSKIDLSRSPAYLQGQIILQDKASCFPAYLLDVAASDGDVIDGCAAPGNKTTHSAAILKGLSSGGHADPAQRVIAFERDKARAKILEKMVKTAAADRIVSVKAGYDFLASKPDSADFSRVGAILLDPSCSGSGIVGRDEVIQIHLPDPQASTKSCAVPSKGKKRKRDDKPEKLPQENTTLRVDLDDAVAEETPIEDRLSERLTSLSTFQAHILTHAMQFPAAHKITYSTCSIHFEENEGVVLRALNSPVAKQGGWRILKRKEQVDGLRKWGRRGIIDKDKVGPGTTTDSETLKDVLEGCIRCEKGSGEGTMGFFVAGFVRDDSLVSDLLDSSKNAAQGGVYEEDQEEEWNGFSDQEDLVQSLPKANQVTNGSSAKTKSKKKRKHND